MKTLLSLLVLSFALVACHATPEQKTATVQDGLKLGVCIMSDVLRGQTDPGGIANDCQGALPAFVLQVVDDFIARKQAQAGWRPDAEVGDIELIRAYDAQRRAMQALAAQSKSK